MTTTTTPALVGKDVYVGQIGMVMLKAQEQLEGDIAELSTQVLNPLREIHFVPEFMESFTEKTLANAAMNPEDLLAHCMGEVMKAKVVFHFFPTMGAPDVEWHFGTKTIRGGIVVSAIAGHPRSMRIAREHGLVPDLTEADQRNLRQFAFEHIKA